jgi:hypothetical protein
METRSRHCERSEAIHRATRRGMDCFVAITPRNDVFGSEQNNIIQLDVISSCFRFRRRPKPMGLVMQHRGELMQLAVAKAGRFERGDR